LTTIIFKNKYEIAEHMQHPELVDQQYRFLNGEEVEHEYGIHVHVVFNPFILSGLARLAAENSESTLPVHEDHNLVRSLYSLLTARIMKDELTSRTVETPTPMKAYVRERGYYRGPANTNILETAMIVGLSRAGTIPAIQVQESISLMTGEGLRTDHIMIERQSEEGVVKRVEIGRSKIDRDPSTGKSNTRKTIFVPDEMLATGTTLLTIYELYTGLAPNEQGIKFEMPTRIVAMTLVSTPEGIRTATKKVDEYRRERPELPPLDIWTTRVDRGLSNEVILKSKLGSFPAAKYPTKGETPPDVERGLNEAGYVVPGQGDRGRLGSRTEYL
jgi:uracil phosphoribosyltransferase